MSIHTVTEETTVTSEVVVLAPPGEPTSAVVLVARKEVDRVRETIGLKTAPTDIYISNPVYQEGRKWLVGITLVFRVTAVVDLDD